MVVVVRTPVETLLMLDGVSELDVSDAVLRGRVTHGSTQANPDRPAVRSARGRLVLVGADYAPGVSTVWSLEQLTDRIPCRVVQGSVDLWEGFVERPTVDVRSGVPVTTFQTVGKSDDRLAQGLAYVNSSGWPSDDDWDGIVGQTPALLGASDLDTAWAPYSFDGRVGAYLGQVGQVTGRLPGEDRTGGLGMATYRQLGTEVPIDNSALLVSAVLTEHVTDVRNIIDFPFDPVAGNTEMAGADGRVTVTQRTGGGLATSYDVVIPIPQPDNPNTTFSDFEVVLAEAFVTVYLHVTGESEPLEDMTITAITYQEVDISDDVDIASVEAGGQHTVTFTIGDFEESFDYILQNKNTADVGITPCPRSIIIRRVNLPLGFTDDVGDVISYNPNSPSSQRCRYSLGAIVDVQLVARLTYTVTSTGLDAVDLQNATSRAAWGDRRLDFPLWIAHSGLQTGEDTRQRIQADLDYLAEPRAYHDITLPLWQTSTADNETVGQLDFGTYPTLDINDPARDIIIAAKTVITSRTLTWGETAGIPSVTIRCQDTGQAAPPPTPTGLTLTSKTHNTITIEWDTVADATSYTTRIDTAETTGITTTSHTFTGLTGSTTYSLSVAAVNADGTSTFATDLSVTTNTAPVQMSNLAAFTGAFTGETTGTTGGRWRADTGGSVITGNTGPGTNNSLAFVHTETSTPGTVSNLEANGLAEIAAIPSGTNRQLRLRVCLQTDSSSFSLADGLAVETTTDGTTWSELDKLGFWLYRDDRTTGDTFDNDDGETLTCAANGGWVDWTLDIDDDVTGVRLAPKYTSPGFRLDQALRELQWT